MPPDMCIVVALANSNHSTIMGTLDQIATQKFREPTHRFTAKITFHVANTLRRKISNDCAMTIETFFAIIQQPVLNQGRDTALLGTFRCMLGLHDFHLCRWVNKSRGASISVFVLCLSLYTTRGNSECQDKLRKYYWRMALPRGRTLFLPARQEINTCPKNQLLITDRLAHLRLISVIQPMRPSPIRGWVIDQFE